MVDVSEIITDPDFAKDYNIHRSATGYFGEGGWIEGEKQVIPSSGPIFPTTSKDLQQVPEGDRVTGAMTFYSTVELFLTRNKQEDKGTSDLLEWKGELYKIIKLLDYSDYGYYKAIATRIVGD